MQFSIRNILIILLFTPFLYGQFTTDPGAGKPTVAILDFEGRGVSPQEVQTLSDRMRTEIGNTNAVRLIERKAVERSWKNRASSSQAVPPMNARRK